MVCINMFLLFLVRTLVFFSKNCPDITSEKIDLVIEKNFYIFSLHPRFCKSFPRLLDQFFPTLTGQTIFEIEYFLTFQIRFFLSFGPMKSWFSFHLVKLRKILGKNWGKQNSWSRTRYQF